MLKKTNNSPCKNKKIIIRLLFNFNTAPVKIEIGKKNHLSMVEFKSFVT